MKIVLAKSIFENNSFFADFLSAGDEKFCIDFLDITKITIKDLDKLCTIAKIATLNKIEIDYKNMEKEIFNLLSLTGFCKKKNPNSDIFRKRALKA